MKRKQRNRGKKWLAKEIFHQPLLSWSPTIFVNYTTYSVFIVIRSSVLHLAHSCHAKLEFSACMILTKKVLKFSYFRTFGWEQRESNPRPSACKADALNQLSYAPVSFLFADNIVRLRIFSRSLPQGNSLLQSLSSLFSTKINFNFLASFVR